MLYEFDGRKPVRGLGGAALNKPRPEIPRTGHEKDHDLLRSKGAGPGTNLLSHLSGSLKKSRKVLHEFLYGMTVREMEVELRKDRGDIGNLFMLIVFGDLAGLPILPPYYAMRLLPYIVPFYRTWRRNILREKDLTDLVSRDI